MKSNKLKPSSQPYIDIGALPPDTKQALWRGIKAQNPALAELLSTDPIFAALKQTFDGKVVMNLEQIDQYLTGNQ